MQLFLDRQLNASDMTDMTWVEFWSLEVQDIECNTRHTLVHFRQLKDER